MTEQENKLVAELRLKCHRHPSKPGNGVGSGWDTCKCEWCRAADEIERLEARVEELERVADPEGRIKEAEAMFEKAALKWKEIAEARLAAVEKLPAKWRSLEPRFEAGDYAARAMAKQCAIELEAALKGTPDDNPN